MKRVCLVTALILVAAQIYRFAVEHKRRLDVARYQQHLGSVALYLAELNPQLTNTDAASTIQNAERALSNLVVAHTNVCLSFGFEGNISHLTENRTKHDGASEP